MSAQLPPEATWRDQGAAYIRVKSRLAIVRDAKRTCLSDADQRALDRLIIEGEALDDGAEALRLLRAVFDRSADQAWLSRMALHMRSFVEVDQAVAPDDLAVTGASLVGEALDVVSVVPQFLRELLEGEAAHDGGAVAADAGDCQAGTDGGVGSGLHIDHGQLADAAGGLGDPVAGHDLDAGAAPFREPPAEGPLGRAEDAHSNLSDGVVDAPIGEGVAGAVTGRSGDEGPRP